jgi:starvation-inducible outer membrane lipoprotein
MKSKTLILSIALSLAACVSAPREPKLVKQDQVQLPVLQAPAQVPNFIETMQNFLQGTLDKQKE